MMSVSYEDYLFPQAINQPKRLFGLQMDEACAVILCVIVGFLTSYYVTAIGFATLFVLGLKFLKKGRPSYFLYDSLYWFLPPYVNGRFFKKLPKSYLRVWIK